MRPPISYYGGKQRMANKIIPLIPKHMIYVEPFAGGCAILFNKPSPEITAIGHYREVINDLDGRLVNFFTQLRDNGDELVRRIQLTLYSEQEYRISKDMSTEDHTENARRYYVNIMQSFASKINGGWGRSKTTWNGAMTCKHKMANLDQYINRMQGIYISNTDAIDCIKVWDSSDTFFYCDPPYINTCMGHYKGYTETDLNILVDTLNNIKGSFVLSGYDSDTPNTDWEKHTFNAYSSATLGNIKGKRTEILWRKLSEREPSELAQKLYASGKFDCYKEQLR